MADRMNLADFGKELSEETGYRISIAGRLEKHRDESHKRRIRAMLKKVDETHIPDEETVLEIEIRLDPWQLPRVTVWCQNDGFNHQNNQVSDGTFVSNGHLHRFKVDVRPF